MDSVAFRYASQNLELTEMGSGDLSLISGTDEQHWFVGRHFWGARWTTGYWKVVILPDNPLLDTEVYFAAGSNVGEWATASRLLRLDVSVVDTRPTSESAERQHDPPTYSVVVFDDARPLLDSLAPELEGAVRQAINETRNGIRVAMLQIRRSTESEDPNWEELIFDVRVHGSAPEALAYWSRIGTTLQQIMDDADPPAREQLARLVSVHVNWS